MEIPLLRHRHSIRCFDAGRKRLQQHDSLPVVRLERVRSTAEDIDCKLRALRAAELETEDDGGVDAGRILRGRPDGLLEVVPPGRNADHGLGHAEIEEERLLLARLGRLCERPS